MVFVAPSWFRWFTFRACRRSVELLPCRINNVTMDSSTEYGKLRPAALDPLGVGNAQTSALVQAFGPVPPPHVHEAEAVFDRGVETMEVK